MQVGVSAQTRLCTFPDGKEFDWCGVCFDIWGFGGVRERCMCLMCMVKYGVGLGSRDCGWRVSRAGRYHVWSSENAEKASSPQNAPKYGNVRSGSCRSDATCKSTHHGAPGPGRRHAGNVLLRSTQCVYTRGKEHKLGRVESRETETRYRHTVSPGVFELVHV